MTGIEIAFSVCNLIATALAALAAVRSAAAAEQSVEAAKKSLEVSEASGNAAEASAKQSLAIAAASEKAAQKSAEAATDHVELVRLQKQLAQRQFIIQLWDRMAAIQPIKAEDPAPAQVHNATSTMELIALCCEGGMIDVAIIKRTYADNYIRLYDMVEACGPIKNMEGKTGKQLLHENPAAMAFYHELKQEKMRRGQLQPT